MRKIVLGLLIGAAGLIFLVNYFSSVYFTRKTVEQQIVPRTVGVALTLERLFKTGINTIKLKEAVKDRDIEGFALRTARHLQNILILYSELKLWDKTEDRKRAISKILNSYEIKGYLNTLAIDSKGKILYSSKKTEVGKSISNLYPQIQIPPTEEEGYLPDTPQKGVSTAWCKLPTRNMIVIVITHKKAISMLSAEKLMLIDKNILGRAIEYMRAPNFYVAIYNNTGEPVSLPHKIHGEDDLPGSPIILKAIHMKSGAFSYSINGLKKTKIVAHIPDYDWYVILTIDTGNLARNIITIVEKPYNISIIIVLSLLFAVLYYISEKNIIKPLKEISTGLIKVSQGNFGFRLHLDARYEIRTLITAFNKMVEKLQQYSRNIENTSNLLNTSLQMFTGVAKLNTKEEIAKKVTQMLKKVKNYNHVTIAIIKGSKIIPLHTDVRINRDIVELVIRTKKIKNIPDIRKETLYLSPPPRTRSELIVPIVDGETVVGIIDIKSEKPAAFEKSDEYVLGLIASFAAVSFRKIQLFNNLKARLDELESLFHITKVASESISVKEISDRIITELAKRKNYSSMGLLILEGKKLRIVSHLHRDKQVPPMRSFDMDGKGIVIRAVKTGEIQNIPDTSKDPDFVELWKETRSELAVPIKVKGTVVGVFNIKSSVLNAFSKHEENFFKSIADISANVIYAAKNYEDIKKAYEELKEMENKLQAANFQLQDYIRELEETNKKVQKKTEELEANYIQTIRALARTIETKDRYTRGHSERVAKLSVKIAQKLGLSEEEQKKILYAGLLHDIGKIGIREEILNKPGKLTPEEYEEIKKHPVYGAKIIKEIEYLKDIYGAVLHHHERWDGNGYPEGLKETEIPLWARIMAVADAYDAMTSERAYRKAYSPQEAIEELERQSGKQFDPNIARAFIERLKRGEEIE